MVSNLQLIVYKIHQTPSINLTSMKNFTKLALGLSFLLLGWQNGQAQISEGGTPPGSLPSYRQGAAPIVYLPRVDVKAALDEDAKLDAQGVKRQYRIAIPTKVSFNSAQNGQWSTLPDGDKVWRLTIASPGAKTLMMALDRFLIPDGALLYVVSAHDRSYYLGGFSNRNQQPALNLGIAPLYTDAVTLEYIEPKDAAFRGHISVGTVCHGYKDLKSIAAFGSSGACNRNVSCAEASRWQDQVNANAMIADASGGGLCSGSMVATTDSSGKSYFLTANHCITGANVGNWVFWFNWQSPTCTNPATNPRNQQTVSGAVRRANSGRSDFALLELNNRPPNNYRVFLNGWNRSYNRPEKGFGIHHPDGDIKKFSTYNGRLTPVVWGGTNAAAWRVVWSTGTTEGGSSGSPIYDSTGLVVGQLYGGGASCTALTSPDNYGRFSTSWDTNAQANAQLKAWLDPVGRNPIRQTGQYLKCQPVARALPFNETFNTAGTAMTVDWENPVSAGVGFNRVRVNAYGGNGASVASQPFANNNPVAGVSRLHTVPYNFKEVQTAILKWDYAASVPAGAADTLELYYSTDCGSTFILIDTRFSSTYNTAQNPVAAAYTPVASEWRRDSVTLPASLSQQRFVQFAIVHRRGALTNSVYFDNIRVEGQAVARPPIANFVALSNNVCAPASIQFRDTSSNNPTSWDWSFQGGTPATSNLRHPLVTYNTPGTFEVKLVVRNQNGADSSIRAGFITIKAPDQVALPMVQDFDAPGFPPAGWRRITNTRGDSIWRQTTSITFQGNTTQLPSGCAYLNNYPGNNRGSRDYLVTPGLNLGAYRSAFLTMNYAYMAYTGNPDTLDVVYSTDCGSTWTNIWTASGANLATVPTAGTAWYIPTTLADFKDEVIPLPSTTSDNVQIAFVNRGGYGQLIYINKVTVDTVGATSLPNDNLLKQARLFPNPNSGKFTVELPEQLSKSGVAITLELTNTLGQIILRKTVAASEAILVDEQNLATGLYFVNLKVGDARVTKTFSVR